MFIIDRLTALFVTAVVLVIGSFSAEANREVAIAPSTTSVVTTVPVIGQEPTTTSVTEIKAPEPVKVVRIMGTTTTTTIPGFSDARCPEVWNDAISVGWPQEWLPLLDRIVYAESRCTSDVISRTKDYGYTQINWSAHKERLESKGITKDMLLDPVINLTEALWIAEYARDNYGCWSQPWYMSGDWC